MRKKIMEWILIYDMGAGGNNQIFINKFLKWLFIKN